MSAATLRACTSIIISGRITPDGRPLLLKNRDCPDQHNLVVLQQGEHYRYLAIVAVSDTQPREAWGGHNEAGFALFNTSAYNLNGPDSQDEECDGQLMRRALEVCGSLKDFEHFLDTLPHPLPINSNFGALDAEGNAAYYETGHAGYTKYDVNDPLVAPQGYLIRTNHAFSGDRSLDRGIERYLAASQLMQQAEAEGRIGWQWLLTDVPRHLTHGLTHQNLLADLPADWNDTRYVAFRDFIPRYFSASTLVVQGVKPGESPLLTVSWTIAGSPLAAVALPLVITPLGKLPQVVTRGTDGEGELCLLALQLKQHLFPLKKSSRADYIDLSKLVNRAGTGILQRIRPIERELLRRGEAELERSRAAGRHDERALGAYYQWADGYIRQQYALLNDSIRR